MQLFGKSLFDKRTVDILYDFAQHGILRGTSNMDYGDYISIENSMLTQRIDSLEAKVKGKDPKKPEKPKEFTPKEVFELKTLNIDDMQIVTDPEYIDDNVTILQDKLGLLPQIPKQPKRRMRFPWGQDVPMPAEAYAGSGVAEYSRREMLSMIERLQNRRKFKEFESVFGEFPYTTSEAISLMLKKHTNLQADNAAPMLSDLPKDAVKAIKTYQDAVANLCNKRPVFYLIVEKKQKQDVQRRRDPILLAQSPFGFFWQILGAWDKEVVFLEEL